MSGDIFVLYVLRHKCLLFLSVAFVIISGSATLLLGKLIGYSVQSMLAEGVFLPSVFFLLSAFSVFLGFIVALRGIVSGLLGMRVCHVVATELCSKIMTAEYVSVKNNIDRIKTVFEVDNATLKNFFSSSGPVFLRNVFTFIGSLLILFFTDRILFLYSLSIIPLILFFFLTVGRKVKKLSRIAEEGEIKLTTKLVDSVFNIKLIKAFAAEDLLLKRFKEIIRNSYNSQLCYITIRSIFIAITVSAILVGAGLLIKFGIISVLEKRIESGALFEFVFYIMLAASSVGRAMELYPDFQNFSNIRNRISMLYYDLVTHQENNKIRNTENFNIIVSGAIKFDTLEFLDVSFSYCGAEETLHKVNFMIRRGEKVAIIGGSGAGKSTIFNLILRFYEGYQGKILINGKDISQIPTVTLREIFAWVPQEVSLISDDLEENIVMAGNNDTNHYSHLCEVLNLDFDSKSSIADFSRGEKQRVNIARAAFSDRQVILLDEATSSLDSYNERDVEKLISAMDSDKTVIMIAHRFSSIRIAEKIIVFEDGNITDVGTHEELLKSSKFYRHMSQSNG